MDAATFIRCKDDIPFFAFAMFGSRLHAKQVEIVESFQANRRTTVRGGVGFGKTHAEAIIIIHSLFFHEDVQVTIFGPTEAQITGAIWKEVHLLWGRMPQQYKELFTVTATKMFVNGAEKSRFAEWRLASKDKPESARGIHQKNNFVIVDEASGIDDEIFLNLNNIMVDRNPKLLLVSNPSRNKGYFYDTHNHDTLSRSWNKIHGAATENPFLAPDALADLIEQYGSVGSRQHRIMILGEFPVDDVDALIAFTDVQEAARNTHIKPAKDDPITWGIDPAGGGNDRSVLTKVHGPVVLDDLKQWKVSDHVQLANLIRTDYENTPRHLKPIAIGVDSNGIGHGLADMLIAMGLPVRRLTAQSKPTRKPERYHSLRDQGWYELKEWLESGDKRLPNLPELHREMCAPGYNTDSGKIKVESKRDLRKKGQRSPDLADAVINALLVRSSIRNAGKYALGKPITYKRSHLS